MGLFDRGAKPSPKGGIEGTATIRESDRSGAAFGQFSDFEVVNLVGTRKYRFALEVQIPDRDPYDVEGEFKVPRRAENTGLLAGEVAKPLQPGVELPVRVDPADPSTVEIDWDKYLATPGRKDAQKAANQSAKNRQMAAHLEKNPKLAAKARAGNKGAVQAWAGAVKMGNMTREEFDAQVDQEIEAGRMDPADAEAARETLDG